MSSVRPLLLTARDTIENLLLQEHPLLAWPLFIFLLALAFCLYPEDYVCIHMQYLFWLTVLSPYPYWLYFL
jgi:hypothetical protein